MCAHPGDASEGVSPPLHPRHLFLIVIPRLQEVDSVLRDEVDDSVLLGEPPGPDALRQMLQWLRLADSSEGILQHGLHDLDGPNRDSTIGPNPVAQILAEFPMEDGIAASPLGCTLTPPRQDPIPPEGPRCSSFCRYLCELGSALEAAALRSLAT